MQWFLCSPDLSMQLSNFLKTVYTIPGLTLHGYLSKILARSCQNLGKILAKILPRIARCHGKISSREPCSQEKFGPEKNPIWPEKN